MSSVTVQLPESLHRNLQALVEREGWSMDQFLASAAAEKMAALANLTRLREDAAQAKRSDFEDYLAAAGEAPVPETDRI